MRQAAEEHGGGKYYPLSTSETDLESVGITMRQDLAAVNVEAIAEGIEFHPQMEGSSPIFNGLSTDSPLAERIPILTGYYGTRPRDEATVPLTYQYVPIYAEWQFGAGKVGSFMSDIGGKWSSGFLSDPSGNGSLLITNIIDNLAPLTQPEPDVLDFTIRETTQNYTNRIDVYADLAEGESVRVSIAYSSLNSSADVNGDYAAASQEYGFGGVPVTDVGNGVSFNFDIVYTGIYRILIEKLDAAGNVIADVHSYRTFSYSSEYDGIRDDEAGARLLSDIAQGGNGVVQTDPVQTIMSFERTLDRTYDPALALLILSAVFILLDIAVRKFQIQVAARDHTREETAQRVGHRRSGRRKTLMPKRAFSITGLLKLLVVAVLAVCMLAAAAGCGAPRLSTPSGLNINELDLTLNWNDVSGAAYYTVRIRGNDVDDEVLASNNSYSLERYAPGGYTVSVRCRSGRQTREIPLRAGRRR